ncbi:MAG: Asp-tRNA(Asn)/Glu-tRNA(Gln) amidotransferase subunit GatC [Gemmatimonadota bacterium]|jgi:aspartyl-tRNA(Asn)/glutamyl-tRNA(Gln) amidotransferase subunit C|nr:Asp-tRNA(Asn)/Glu-tRNA(Gln) amidotransferase GatCAB subunit C [Gemmatimonadota bacterium]MDP6461368.1 Asp-tRNA(Asn)/Glu-tRNA(Gln) amidotransferase subunit GatC [Gemmatimonadota bacterium]MDP6528373.1 Asp-tRNA(Asn)/Glu-tRNA(Gln) amidotransferase subunit GatC [Gemmatimonadota bacterium]MDP6802829.1 Asp-tRNA(Asn)/Glu-tRNA(Gln) amidotransferase subunit GatC [Gemmatimonadota bacterium]MDP7031042.1 Asp-tRNA(Asn)/Glu-tRNA(Gln) amidotransferase subunit GatC [Gemmatimonadota bacterium]
MMTREEVLRVARLARLDPSPAEADRLAVELGRIFQHMAALNEAPAPAGSASAGDGECPLRPDEVRPSLSRAEVMALAPESDGESYRVPPVLDRSGEDA